MAERSGIEWTDATWNPVTGCNKVSPGCKHCYAERLALRLQWMGNPRYARGFNVTLHPDLVGLPLTWRQPRFVFVNSMSDLFHEEVPLAFIQAVFATMECAHWHVFQVLTKRASRLVELASSLPWPKNVWVGVSVERQDYVWRVDYLRHVPAAVRFLSCEPLLGPVRLDLSGINWVIAGGESGPRARPMKEEWLRSMRDQSVAAGVPFFFKQWGGVRDKRGHSKALLDGTLWRDWPHGDGRNGENRNIVSEGHPLPTLGEEASALLVSTRRARA
ncbi:MAG: phage Gp37/Gp68 family protein [Chloroflexi bacterium]|nr:phage Gp37/Gp68 family protein [Chloroflexota bacterium]